MSPYLGEFELLLACHLLGALLLVSRQGQILNLILITVTPHIILFRPTSAKAPRLFWRPVRALVILVKTTTVEEAVAVEKQAARPSAPPG